ncbi:sensor domain-containing protein [Halorarum salinum]|uniref:Sensor domain-containing protein n=1 Tax=Halorarum salinum TaxID=2743089 RepID=A0A7D5QAQ8_9EURY|nr:sensor domain-containing protein [Halobaculum salinum]QLG60481.1 sensor domain-containing protein [Halobaculum salinum]
MPTQTATHRDRIRRFAGVPLRRQTYRNLAYLALAFPLGLVYFVTVSIGLSLGAGLLVTWFGLPIVVLTLVGATVIAGVEATLARRLLGTDVDLPRALRGTGTDAATTRPDDGILASLERFLLAPTTWTSLVLVGVKFVFGVAAFTVLVTAGSLAGALLAAPVLYDDPHVTYRIYDLTVTTLPHAITLFVGGLLLTLASLHALNFLARLGGALTAALLAVGGEASGAESPT